MGCKKSTAAQLITVWAHHPGGSKNLESTSRNGNILHEYEKSGAAKVRLEFVFAGGERLIISCRKCKNIRTQT